MIVYNHINDNNFKQSWNKVPKIFTKNPNFLDKRFMNSINPRINNHIDGKKSPFYKLSHKINHHKFNILLNDPNSIMYILKSKLTKQILDESSKG